MHYHADTTQVNKYGKTPLTLAAHRAAIDYQDLTAYRTILQTELEKRHGTQPDDNFSKIKYAFATSLNEYIQSKFIYNWQLVRHHDRAFSFGNSMVNVKSTTEMIHLLKSQLSLFEEDAKEDKNASKKHHHLPHNHTKDGFNQLLEDFLEIFERAQNKENIEHVSTIKRSASDSELLSKETKEEKYSVRKISI